MPRCSAFQCVNKGVHSFPADKKRRDIWIKALRLKNWTLISSNTPRICAEHFRNDDYEDSVGVPYEPKILKKDAVPSLFIFAKQDAVKLKSQYRDETQTVIKSTGSNSTHIVEAKKPPIENGVNITNYGHCRCCLKEDTHTVGDVWEMLECFNIELCLDPLISVLVCAECSKFLQQARRFRDMVAASQATLLAALNSRNMQQTIVDVTYVPDTGQFKEEMEQRTAEPVRINTQTEQIASQHETVIKKCTTSNAALAHSEVKQELLKVEESLVPPCPPAPAEPPAQASDDDNMQGGGISDDSDAGSNDKDDKPKLTAREEKTQAKIMEAKLNLRIRENLSTILQNSTIIPFTTAKGDQYECIYCDKNYTHFKELRNHVEKIHNTEEYEFKLQALNLVPELILRADVSILKCRICNEGYATIDNLVQHLINIHDIKYHSMRRDPPHNVLCFDMSLSYLKCLDCDKMFSYFRGLLMHMNQHYGSYLCPQCGGKFLYEHSYKLHMHQKHKPNASRLQCLLCDASYARKSHLKRHVKTKHPND